MAKVYTTIEHKISANEDFTGAASPGALTNPAGATAAPVTGPRHLLYAYAAAAAGGLFDPAIGSDVARVRVLERITLSMGGQTAWAIDILDQDNNVRVDNAWSGTNEATYQVIDPRILLPGEKIKLTTTDMTAAGTATVTFSEEA